MDATLEPVVDGVRAAAAALLAGGGTPGLAAAVVRDGELAWSGGFGLADPFTGRQATAGTLFRIASVTKPFTAAAILQLRDDGRLALHDPLVAHLPECRRLGDPFGALERVTIGQVLLHIAGLQADVPTDPRALPGLTQERLLARLGEAHLVRPPDTRWHYSNLGYELLAVLVARVGGRPYPEHLAETILDPAGLSDTTYHPGPSHEDRLAVGAERGITPGAWQAVDDVDSDHLLGDGGLWSTVDDLARWISVNCHITDGDRRGDGRRVLDGPSMRELQRPLALVDLRGWQSAQGPGWASFRVDENAWVGHTGSLPGFRSLVLFRPEERMGVAVLATGSVRPTPVAHAACRALVGAHPAVAREDAQASPRRSAHGPGPLGRWRGIAVPADVRVADHEGALWLRHDGEPPARLVPTATPREWRVAGDGPDAGERVRHVPEDAAGPERLHLGAWPMARQDD